MCFSSKCCSTFKEIEAKITELNITIRNLEPFICKWTIEDSVYKTRNLIRDYKLQLENLIKKG